MTDKLLIDLAVVEQALEAFDGGSWEQLRAAEALRAALAEQPAEREPEGSVCGRCGGLVFDPILPQPAKAELQPLTDEEIGQVRWQCRWNRMSTDDNLVSATKQQLDAFARAIEAKILEKFK